MRRQVDVGGRAADCPSQLAPVGNPPAQDAAVSQNLFRFFQTAFAQGLPHGGTAGADAGHEDARRALGNEATVVLQQVETARAVAAETEIVADQQITGV